MSQNCRRRRNRAAGDCALRIQTWEAVRTPTCRPGNHCDVIPQWHLVARSSGGNVEIFQIVCVLNLDRVPMIAVQTVEGFELGGGPGDKDVRPPLQFRRAIDQNHLTWLMCGGFHSTLKLPGPGSPSRLVIMPGLYTVRRLCHGRQRRSHTANTPSSGLMVTASAVTLGFTTWVMACLHSGRSGR
jgi:hypothetical protein